MSSKIILYVIRGSPPCRACVMLARILNLDIELKYVRVQKKEHLSESFKKLNPLSVVPVLVDGDFVLSESRAILGGKINF